MKSIAGNAYVLGSSRIPFAKSQTTYPDVTRKDLLVAALNGLIERFNLERKLIGDVSAGAVMNGAADFNLAREAVLSTKLHPDTPAYNVQRACGTGLEAAWQIALKAHVGAIDTGIVGGADTNSDLPIEVSQSFQSFLLELNKAKNLAERLKVAVRFKPSYLKPKTPTVDEPRTKLSMGQHCELMVKEWKISREEQDAFALQSHLNGSKAYASGFYDDLVVPFHSMALKSMEFYARTLRSKSSRN